MSWYGNYDRADVVAHFAGVNKDVELPTYENRKYVNFVDVLTSAKATEEEAECTVEEVVDDRFDELVENGYTFLRTLRDGTKVMGIKGERIHLK